MKINSHKDLIVWQKSMSLCLDIYNLSALLPRSEKYNLISQMQRSCISIPSNIAEGYARNSTGDYARFLKVSFGSAAELETQLLLIGKLKLAQEEKLAPIIDEVVVIMKMLNALIKALH